MASGRGQEEEVPVLTHHRIQVPDANDTYSFLNAIGKGGYADVYKIQNSDGASYACKAIPKFKLTSVSKQNKVKMEIAIHRSLDHDHIVRFMSNFEDDVFIFIVLEYCQHRSMNILIKQRLMLTDPEVRYFMIQVIDALSYLHSKRIIHRDLKAGNILLKGTNRLVAKLCDFGLSAVLSHDAERRKTICGTPNYIAPEILQNTGHSYEADVWSLACLMFALITGKPPFQTRPIKEIYSRVMQARYRIHAIPDHLARDLIKSTLVTDPEQRPRLNVFRNHDYFNEWYPGAITTEVYDTCPKVVKDWYKEQKTGSVQGSVPNDKSSSNTTSTQGQSQGRPNGASKNGYGFGGLLAQRKPMVQYASLITNMNESPRPTNCGSVPVDYGEMNEDGNKLIALIENCISSYKQTNSLKAIPKLDISMLWAIKWVDYSDTRQGFGYQLSDGSYGVLFRNDSKMILLPDSETLLFLTKKEVDPHNQDALDAFVDEVKEKRARLDVFVTYMNTHLVGFNIDNIKNRFASKEPDEQAFPVTWTRGWDEDDKVKDYLIIIVLKPAIYQINFEDHSKVILDYNAGNPLVMYQKDGSIALLASLETLEQSGFTEDLLKKLKIAANNFRRIVRPSQRAGD